MTWHILLFWARPRLASWELSTVLTQLAFSCHHQLTSLPRIQMAKKYSLYIWLLKESSISRVPSHLIPHPHPFYTLGRRELRKQTIQWHYQECLGIMHTFFRWVMSLVWPAGIGDTGHTLELSES